MFKQTGAAVALSLALAGMAQAAGTHQGGHHEAVLQPAPPSAEPDRTIDISMVERQDGSMGYEPSEIEATLGETVRFAFRNKGRTEHEFVPGSHAELMEHKAEMAEMPDMAHDDEASLRLPPGATASRLVTFETAGTFEFACLIPGHYEAGMHGTLVVREAAKGQ